MNIELQRLAKEKQAEGMPLEEIGRFLRVRRITVAAWLGVPVPKYTAAIPVVPDVEVRIYRVLTQPTLTARKEGGWTAEGKTVLTTKNSTRAIQLCGENKGSVVVENHGIVLRHNKVKSIPKLKCCGWGFVFGSSLNG